MDAIPARPPRRAAHVVVPPQDLAAVREAYDRGRFLDAWQVAGRHGPLSAWRGADALLLGGRLAGQLGAARLGARLHLRAFREHPDSPHAWQWAVRAVRMRRGPYEAREAMRRIGRDVDDDPEALALRAELATDLLDFEEAERHLSRALAIAPAKPWLHVVRGMGLRDADACEAALESADRALDLRPWYRPALDLRADVLVLLGRDEEALALLEEASRRLQAASVATDLALLQIELGRHAEAEATLGRLEELTPLREREHAAWIEGRRADVAYHRGDLARAADHARRSTAFYVALAARLEAAIAPRRVVLGVPWVRQHRLTCVPATLSALVQYFGEAAEHLEIAEAICYDGTPDTAQRAWAEEHGFVAREFTVTWDAAVALLDRGVPFALTTIDPGNGHMQAVVGYDVARGTLLLRDPSSRYMAEITGGDGLRAYAHCGPRGLVVLPPAEARRIAGLALPEEDLHDVYHRVQAALAAHDRTAAAAAAAELDRRAPRHRLALQAERALASYDADEPRRLRATEALLALFPDEVNLRLSKQASLADLGRRDARIAWLRAECARARHPLLQLVLAEVLREDARCRAGALGSIRGAARVMWRNGAAYHALANALWEEGRREDALAAYRTAACLQRTNERYAESYFLAARLVRRAPEALEFLRDRFERHRRKAAGPALTLHAALDLLERGREALEVLEAAVASRPDDGPLLLFAARARAAAGDAAAAEGLVARARTRARPTDVKRTSAQLAEAGGDLVRAATLWSEVVEAEPFNLEAVRAAARLLAATADQAAAVAFLRGHVDRHPHHHLLGGILAEWLEDAPPAEREATIRRILEANPSDAWAWRELALALASSGRSDEAEQAVARAGEIDPQSPSYHFVRASVLEEAGNPEAAKAALRAGLEVTVDAAGALRQLLRMSADAAEREGHLRFVHGEIVRQVLSGDALLAYQDAAAGVLEPERLVVELRAAWEARPDLWHAWAALARQLLLAGRPAEAVALLARAAARFDLVPRIWLELANAHRAAGDRAAQRVALERAVSISPAWSEAVVRLAELLHADREFAAERALLAGAARRNPSDALLHGWLADASWSAGERDFAVAELERALRLDPTYAWAWEAHGRFCRELGRAGHPLEVAQEIARERPHDANAWVLLARARGATEERLEALGRALAIAPRHADAYELRVQALADAGRYDEALAAADAPIAAGRAPRTLRLLAARLQARRGERGLARVALEELLAQEPDFAEGWAQLAEWHEEEKRYVDAADAARRLVRLAPNHAMSHGYLAGALLGAGERAAAKAALQRALQLDPAYAWAIRRLLDVEIEDGSADGAAAALALIERHLPEDSAAARVRVAALRGDRAAALSAFGEVVPGGERWHLEAAARAIDEEGWEAELDAVLDPLLDHPSATRAAGALFADRARAQGWKRARRKRLDAALAGTTPTASALGAAEERLRQLARPAEARALRRFLARHRGPLAADTATWAQAGYALLSARRRREAVEWLAGWRTRQGVEPWMLLNLASALRDLGRDRDAAEASAAALELPTDHTTPLHEVMLALDAAMSGDHGAARAHLSRAHGDLGSYWGVVLELANAALASATGAERRAAFAAATAHLRAAAALRRDLSNDPYLRRARRAATWRAARHRAGSGALAPLYWLVAMGRAS
jgi:tetratricopeptide (TPR) repeat protein